MENRRTFLRSLAALPLIGGGGFSTFGGAGFLGGHESPTIFGGLLGGGRVGGVTHL